MKTKDYSLDPLYCPDLTKKFSFGFIKLSSETESHNDNVYLMYISRCSLKPVDKVCIVRK